jgi:translation initiation factor 2 subunit 2
LAPEIYIEIGNDSMDYETLLKRGLENTPKTAIRSERWEIPKSIAMKDGLKTILSNFYDIANDLRRDPEHLLKFLLKQLATSCDSKDGKRVVIWGNFSAEAVNRKIEIYVKGFVLCPECGKPDTKLVKEDKFSFVVCEACGARHPVGKI